MQEEFLGEESLGEKNLGNIGIDGMLALVPPFSGVDYVDDIMSLMYLLQMWTGGLGITE